MKCIYYLSPNLESSKKISDHLHEIGVHDWYLHVISKDESGLQQEHIHSGNYLETLDLVRTSIIGAIYGFGAAIVIVSLLLLFQPFGPDVSPLVYAAIIVATTLFGIWEGGLFGIATENKKLKAFHDDLEAGKYLFLIYAPRKMEQAIQSMMAEQFPEAVLSAVDSHFINPFYKLKRFYK